MKSEVALKALLGFVAASHLILGIAAIFVPPGEIADQIIEISYGGSFSIDPVTHHIIRILGAFMLFVGVMAIFALNDPRRYSAVVYALIFLFVVRVLQRLLFAGEIQEYLAVPTSRIIMQSVFFLALAAALFFLRLTSSRNIGSGPTH